MAVVLGSCRVHFVSAFRLFVFADFFHIFSHHRRIFPGSRRYGKRGEFSPRTPASKATPGSPVGRSALRSDCGRDQRDSGTTLFLELKLQLCPEVFGDNVA